MLIITSFSFAVLQKNNKIEILQRQIVHQLLKFLGKKLTIYSFSPKMLLTSTTRMQKIDVKRQLRLGQNIGVDLDGKK